MGADESAFPEIPGEHEGDKKDVAVEDTEKPEEGGRRVRVHEGDDEFSIDEVVQHARKAGVSEGDGGENHHALVGGGILAQGDADGEENEEATDIDDVNGDEGIREWAVGFDLHHDCGVNADGAHDAHEASPCDEEPAELAVNGYLIFEDEEQLRGEEEHPDGECCSVRMQEQGRVLT